MQARSRVVLLGAATLLATSGRLGAQTATQVVRFRVVPASRIAVAPVKTPLSTRANGPMATETHFAIATSEAGRKLVVSLDRALPPRLQLTVALTPAAGAMATRPVVLDTVATDLLTSIPVSVEDALPVRYTLSRDTTRAREPVTDGTLLVTYTVTSQPD